jgi:hypothetical protein
MDETSYVATIGILALSIVVFYLVVVCMFTPFL